MDKKSGSKGTSSTSLQSPASLKIEANRGSAGKGSEERGVYINERGETCYGNECVTLTLDAERREIRVNIKQDATCNVDTLVEGLRDVMAKGARTVYEVESVFDKSLSGQTDKQEGPAERV